MKCEKCKEELTPCWKSIVKWSQADIDFQEGGSFFEMLKNNIVDEWLECHNPGCEDWRGK